LSMDKFELVENFAEIIIQAQEILDSDDIVRKRQLVQSISLNLSVFDGKLKISFKKPFSFFFKRQEQQKFVFLYMDAMHTASLEFKRQKIKLP